LRASKVLLLVFLLGFGLSIETAWRVRNRIDVGPAGCRVLGGKFYGPSFSFDSQSRSEAPERTAVRIDNAFGSVEVRAGERGEVVSHLRSVVYLANEQRAREFAQAVLLKTSLNSGVLAVTTNRQELDSRDVGLETHLEVAVPPGTRVTIYNQHGRVQVAEVGELEVDNAYELTTVERVAAATLRTRHGDVHVAEVAGAVSLISRYGDVDIRDVTGRLHLESEHGDVKLQQLGGLEGQVRYGELNVEGITGELKLEGEHAEVHASDVSGGVVVSTSYRDGNFERIGGDLRFTGQHSSLTAGGVRGGVKVETSYDDVTLTDVGGPVEVKVEHGGVHAERLAKGAQVIGTGDDIVIDGFRGALTINAQRGSVHLVPDGPLVEPVTASVTNGGISLAVPAASHFQFVASTRSGEVQVDVPGLSINQSSRTHVAGTLGGGGNLVSLSAEHGDVQLESHADVAAASPSPH